jgi:hypothetical protein
VTHGALGGSHFDQNLAHDLGPHALKAHHAVLFTADSGSLAGKTFLVVDANGKAGYQAGHDFVIQLNGAAHLHDLSLANFV